MESFKILKAICSKYNIFIQHSLIEDTENRGCCADTRVGAQGGARELLNIHREG